MSKTGQAPVLSFDQLAHLSSVIQEQRHPEKNTVLFQIIFKLELQGQKISRLQLKDIAESGSATILPIPDSKALILLTRSRSVPAGLAISVGENSKKRFVD